MQTPLLMETQQAGQEFQFNRDATRRFRPYVCLLRLLRVSPAQGRSPLIKL